MGVPTLRGMVLVGPDREPSEEWRAEMAAHLSAFVAPHLEPLVAQLNRSLVPALKVFHRWALDTATPWVANFAALTEQVAATVLTPEFLDLLERVREARPANWPSPIDLPRVTSIIQDDGIPLVWVPRAELIDQVVQAADRESRIGVLLVHRDQVIDDCRCVLGDVSEPSLAAALPLARSAVDALADGHAEAAQALATVVTESTISKVRPGAYQDVRKQLRAEAEQAPWDRMRLALALAPIHRFYTPWFPHWQTAPPEALSRHRTVHNADIAHFNPGNALIAVMLVTSVLRGVQEQLEGLVAEPEP